MEGTDRDRADGVYRSERERLNRCCSEAPSRVCAQCGADFRGWGTRVHCPQCGHRTEPLRRVHAYG